MSSDFSSEDEKVDLSTQFKYAVKIGELEGKLAVLQSKLKTSSSDPLCSDQAPTVIMATAKNKITFSDKDSENIDNFLKDFSHLRMANKWDDNQEYGHILCSLKNQAASWYKNQDESKFKTSGKFDVELLKTELKTRFKKDVLPGDIMFRIMDNRQK